MRVTRAAAATAAARAMLGAVKAMPGVVRAVPGVAGMQQRRATQAGNLMRVARPTPRVRLMNAGREAESMPLEAVQPAIQATVRQATPRGPAMRAPIAAETLEATAEASRTAAAQVETAETWRALVAAVLLAAPSLFAEEGQRAFGQMDPSAPLIEMVCTFPMGCTAGAPW